MSQSMFHYQDLQISLAFGLACGCSVTWHEQDTEQAQTAYGHTRTTPAMRVSQGINPD